jgi:acyl-CoA thioesterase I
MMHFVRAAGVCCSFTALVTTPACESRSSATAPSRLSAGSSPATRRVVVLGDSLATYPSNEKSFPAVLQRRMSAGSLPWKIANAGVSGDTTSGGLTRLDPLLGDDVGVLVLALGANDGLRGVDLAIIERNLSTITERVQARGIRVLLCGMETPPWRSWDYSVEFHRLFPRLAAKYDVPLVPFLLAGVALNPDLNGSDGIHPNAAGAQRIADTVWPYLEPLLRD